MIQKIFLAVNKSQQLANNFLKSSANMPTKRSEKQIFAPIFRQFLAGARLFLLPGISEEGFDVGVRDRLAVDFFETGHQQLHVLDRDMLARTVVEAGMDFLSGHFSFTISRFN